MVSNETVRISYAGNNSTSTPYVVPFLFLSNADLVVVTRTSGGVETTLTVGVDYTLSGAGLASGGSFTTASAVPVTSTVIIYLARDGFGQVDLAGARTQRPDRPLRARW